MKEHNKTEIVVLSPGRINLIGEHIDYHGGCVLPASIDLCIEIRLRKKEGKYWEIKSTQSADSFCQKVLQNSERSSEMLNKIDQG